jgi:hypothetical protein
MTIFNAPLKSAHIAFFILSFLQSWKSKQIAEKKWVCLLVLPPLRSAVLSEFRGRHNGIAFREARGEKLQTCPTSHENRLKRNRNENR